MSEGYENVWVHGMGYEIHYWPQGLIVYPHVVRICPHSWQKYASKWYCMFFINFVCLHFHFLQPSKHKVPIICKALCDVLLCPSTRFESELITQGIPIWLRKIWPHLCKSTEWVKTVPKFRSAILGVSLKIRHCFYSFWELVLKTLWHRHWVYHIIKLIMLGRKSKSLYSMNRT